MPQTVLAPAKSFGPVVTLCRFAQYLIGNDRRRNAAKTTATVVALIFPNTIAPITIVGQPNSNTRPAIDQSVSLAYMMARLEWLRISATVMTGTAALMPIRWARIEAMTMPPAIPVAPCSTPVSREAIVIAASSGMPRSRINRAPAWSALRPADYRTTTPRAARESQAQRAAQAGSSTGHRISGRSK